MIENLGYDSSKGLSLVMEKHGSHDQKTHGSWATGVSSEVASDIQQFTREWGGLSISMVDGHMPTKGYMVSKPPEFGKIVDEADFFDPIKGPKILSQYMREQKADLATGKNYLGTWLNEGKIYLDVSENIMDRAEATSLGAQRNQLKIWDVVNQVEIDTGGTGRVEKENRDGGVEEPRRYDGRGDRRLRDGSLEKVRGESGQVQVIRFEYGLKPVFKHEGGPEHDQKSHGNWATGQGYTEEQAQGIARFENIGPTLDDLDKALEGIPVPTYDDLREFVLNDGEQYDEMSYSQDLDERVRESTKKAEERLGRPLTDQEKANIYEQESEYAVKNYILENQSDLANLRNQQMNLIDDPESLAEPFNDVYFSSVNVVEPDGNEYEMYSKVEEVNMDDEGIHVKGNIYADGQAVGNFERLFFKEGETWVVEHKWLDIEDNFQGKGFGKEFLQQAEDYYTAKGFGYIKLMAGLDDGARHWARAGFDWDPDGIRSSAEKLKSARNYALNEEEKPAFDAIFERMYDSNVASPPRRVRDMRNPDFPMPAEFANLGWEKRVRDADGEWDWAGKRLMQGLVMDYVKPLTAEGRNLLSGPIDRDGDGLIYDGTGRERPAPKNN
jgi:GNAT superfamily N-acetyltransferase